MIIGRGLIAAAFENETLPHGVLIFASGVSNSKETDPLQFRREMDLLSETIRNNPDKKLVYFSTASVLDVQLADEPYVRHKLQCEELIRNLCAKHLILRVTNVVGNSGNPNTVFKFFVDRIRGEEVFELWRNACRNLVDVEDVVRISLALLAKNNAAETFLLANPVNHAVPELLATLEQKLGKNAVFISTEKGSCAPYPMAETLAFYDANGFSFSADYLKKLIDRYVD
jgi:nucleoside-diphosphate-sugar epimerase